MKQHITTKQLNELSEKGKQGLDAYLKKLWGITNPVYEIEIGHRQLSIGQMIEFLGEEWQRVTRKSGFCPDNEALDPKNLCNALWEAVKETLND